MKITTVLLPALGLLSGASGARKSSDAILLSSVKTLTLRGHGALTSHRRVDPIPQLECISHPSLCRLATRYIDLMRCTNTGSSYADQDIQWSCTAVLPEELRLGATDVICEGYSRPDDRHVLRGSCGVRYTVALTDKGEERYPSLVAEMENGMSKWTTYLFYALFFGVLAWIIHSAWSSYNGNAGNNARRPPRRPWGGDGGFWPGGGGGFGGGWDPGFGGGYPNEPPPPYPGKYTSQQGSTWRPGFWSGLAAGGAAAYAAANSRDRNRNRDDGYDRRGAGGGGLWSTRRRTGESSSSSSSASGRRYEGTGFGGTARR